MSTLVDLPVAEPFAAAPLLASLRGHTVPGLERHDTTIGSHTRAVRGAHGPALVTVTFDRAPTVRAAIDAAHRDDLPALEQTVRRWLDLDADPVAVDTALSADPLLAPLVTARPGLRVLGSPHWFDTAVQTVIGQQVSVAAGCTFTARLVASYGEPAPRGFMCFPLPHRLADADPDELRAAVGLTRARARTVQVLARAAADGLSPALPDFRNELLALPGIGPWTVDYLAVRALGDRDAYPGGDLVLRRALGVATAGEAEARAEPWSPWRAYAATHLWTETVYSSASVPADAGSSSA
ncbi:DNA-3-methyladenine glycosylase family protein [Rhodococcus phenolicus]|uniref:DNA-3-methyladenine glycosylase family protein n=1 Tax=Rhodococcus phenolicus TaxID=263849 RepID=UPI0008337F4D|nr:AlkA N-terminal domain-containing protein [Rhodococcus phenolicus]